MEDRKYLVEDIKDTELLDALMKQNMHLDEEEMEDVEYEEIEFEEEKVDIFKIKLEPKVESLEDMVGDVNTTDLYEIKLESEDETDVKIKNEDSSQIEMYIKHFMNEEPQIKIEREIKEEDLTSNSDVSSAALKFESVRDLRASTLNARFLRQSYTEVTRQSTSNARRSRRSSSHHTRSVPSASEPRDVKPLKQSTSHCGSKGAKTPTSASKKVKQSGSRKKKQQISKVQTKPSTAGPSEVPATFSGQLQSSISVKTQVKSSTPISKKVKQSTLVANQVKPRSTCVTGDANPSACNAGLLTLSTVDTTSVNKQVKLSTSSNKQGTPTSNSRLLKLLTSGAKQLKPSDDPELLKPSTSSAKQGRLSFDSMLVKPSTSSAKQVRLSFDSNLVNSSTYNVKQVQTSDDSELVKPSTSSAKQVRLSFDSNLVNSSTYNVKQVQSSDDSELAKLSTSSAKRVRLSFDSNLVNSSSYNVKQVQSSDDPELAKPSTSSAKRVRLSFDSNPVNSSTYNVKQLKTSDDSELVKPSTSSAKQVRLSFDSKLVNSSTYNIKQVQPSNDSKPVKPSTSSPKQVRLSFDSKLVKPSTSSAKHVGLSFDSKLVKLSNPNAKQSQLSGSEQVKPSTSSAKQVKLLPNSNLHTPIIYISKPVIIQTCDIGAFNAHQVNPSLVAKQVPMSTSNGEQVKPLVYFTQPVNSSGLAQVGTSHSQPLKPSSSVPTQGKLYRSVATQVTPLTAVTRQMKPTSDGQMKVSTYDIGQGPSTSYIRQGPSTSYIGQEPSTSYIGQGPSTSYIGQGPSTSYIGQGPSTSYIGQGPSTSYIGQGPSTSYVGQGPSTSYVGQGPSTSYVGQGPSTSYIGQGPSTSYINAIKSKITSNSQNRWPTTSILQKVVEFPKRNRKLKQLDIRFTKSVKALEQEERQMIPKVNCSLKELLDNYEFKKFGKNKSNKLVPYINITRKELLYNFLRHSIKDFLRLYEDTMGSVRFQDPSSPIIPRCQVLRRFHQLAGSSQSILLGSIETKRKFWSIWKNPTRPYPQVTADCCSKNDFFSGSLFDGFRINDLLQIFGELRGTYHKPNCLIEMAERLFAYLHISFQHEKLEEELSKGELVQFTKLVVWTRNYDRSLSKLYSPYKPDKYHEQIGKIMILKKVTEARKPRKKVYPFMCHVCYASFRYMPDFAAHFLESNREITYLCASCGFLRFSSICSLIYHILIDRIDGPNTEMCLVCKEPQFSLSEHYATDIPGIGMKCASCEFLAGSFCAFKIHALNHLENVPFICEACGKSFLHKKLFIDHQKRLCFIKYRKTFYICCFIHFSDEKMFEQHLRAEHIKTFCEPCNAEITDIPSAVSHFQQMHSPTSSEQQNLQVFHWCDNCNEYFDNFKQDDHCLHYHKNRPMCAAVVYKCVCEFVTYYKFKLSHHIENSCRGEDDLVVRRPHILKKCQVCRDVKAYNFIDPFGCESCLMAKDKKFKSRRYKCNICNRVINFDWSEVHDHFYLNHNSKPLIHTSSFVSLIEIFGENQQKVISPQLRQITRKEFSSTSFNTQYYQKSTENESKTFPIFSEHAYYLEPNDFDGQVKVFIPKSFSNFVPAEIKILNQKNTKKRNKKSKPASGQPPCSVPSRPNRPHPPPPRLNENSLIFDFLVNPPNPKCPLPEDPCTFESPSSQAPCPEYPTPQHPSLEPLPPQPSSSEPTPRFRILTTDRTEWYLRPGQYEEY